MKALETPALPDPAKLVRREARRRRIHVPAALRTPRGEKITLAVYLVVLTAFSVFLHSRALTGPFWTDEGIAAGIASNALGDIPDALAKDGAPPLYYLLLHGWMQAFGDGEAVVRSLSLLFATAFIPAGLWAAWTLFGRRAGVICATLAALNPYLGSYGQETRMYALLALLGLLAAAAFALTFVQRRSGWKWVYAALQAVLLYTHNWGLFFLGGALLTLALIVWRAEPGERRGLVRDGAVAFGGAIVVYLPWVPLLIGQTSSTGAPWANEPSFGQVFEVFGSLFGGYEGAIVLMLGVVVGLVTLFRRPLTREARTALALFGVAEITLLSALVASQLNPAYAPRYLGVILGAYLLVAAAALGRAGWIGIAALFVSVILWAATFPIEQLNNKANADDLSIQFSGQLRPDDLIVSTQPEQVPLLHYYFADGPRYATLLGGMSDPRVFDWRNALDKLERTNVEKDLRPLLDRLPVGGRLLLVSPITDVPARWKAPWTKLVRRRDGQWTAALRDDRRFRALQPGPRFYKPVLTLGMRAVLYEKQRS